MPAGIFRRYSMTCRPIGIYIHVPFCSGKCPYCDFYSVAPSPSLSEDYIRAVERELRRYPALPVGTVYFGGGTPTLLGADGLIRLLDAVKRQFDVACDAEITFEMNPRTAEGAMLGQLRQAGFNRVSMGVQSAVDSELQALGRRHTAADASAAMKELRQVGFENISLDLMLGIPDQTEESLCRSIDRICALEPEHISAYILKIEPDTPFARLADSLCLADEDGQADLYTLAVNRLASRGYERYEISNFARSGKHSRHNTAYWDCGEYLGFGPAAHSFFGGRRFYYPRDIMRFISEGATVVDGEGGGREEYLMLRLRLTQGVTNEGWRERFGEDIPKDIHRRAAPLAAAKLLEADEKGIRLQGDGFLLSNAVIGRLLPDGNE